ncbi:MAG: RadC family protein [Candidatus Fimenecus sp.]
MADRKTPIGYESKNGIKYGVDGNIIKTVEPVKKSSNNNKNIHDGHRQRLRERFLRDGLEGFEDHNVLELLLFYSIPVRDTNEDAHRLIREFGSLSGVFDAKYDDILKVKGIGDRTALLIKLIPELFRRYEVDKLNKDTVMLNSAELVAKYVSKHFKGLTEEKLYALYLDSNCRLLSFQLISSGGVNSAPMNNRLIAEYAYSTNAASVILVHNHPSGICAPSRKDIDATIAVADIMEAIGIRLSDHIIIGNGDDYFSFRLSPKWKHIFK